MPTESYFFVDQTNETVGPISWEVLLQLANAGAVSAETPTASGGSSDWVPFSELRAHVEAKAKLPPVPSSSLRTHAEKAMARPAQEEPRVAEVSPRMNAEVRSAPVGASVRRDTIKWDLALFLLGLATSLGVSSDIASYVGKSEVSDVFAGIGLVALIPAIIFGSILHYQCWHALPIEYRATSPERAIGFLFIPFFNLYWAFVSWVKLADGYEVWQRESKATMRYTMRGLGITQAVFFCLPYLLLPVLPLYLQYPFISIAMGIASLTVFGLFYFNVVAAANQLISGQSESYRHSKEVTAGWSSTAILVVVGVLIHTFARVIHKSIHPFFIAVVPLVMVFLLVLFLRRK